jgi:hypothetical protein
MSSNEILLICSKIITKNPDDIYNQSVLNTIDQIQLNFTNHNSEQLYILQETLKSFDTIIRATTIQLWNINMQKQREINASLKFKVKMEAEHIASATLATATVIDRALENIDNTNNFNQATEFRIHNLEKQSTEQKQTANEILNQLKRKNKEEYPYKQQVPATNPFTLKNRNNPSQTYKQHNNTIEIFPPNKKRKGIQWDNDGTKIAEYNPTSTPIQTFSHSKLLQPNYHTPDTTPLSLSNPFQLIHAQHTTTQLSHPHHYPPQIQLNPNPNINNPFSTPNTQPITFQNTYPQHHHQQLHLQPKLNNPFTSPNLQYHASPQKFQGGKHRGGRRGATQR